MEWLSQGGGRALCVWGGGAVWAKGGENQVKGTGRPCVRWEQALSLTEQGDSKRQGKQKNLTERMKVQRWLTDRGWKSKYLYCQKAENYSINSLGNVWDVIQDGNRERHPDWVGRNATQRVTLPLFSTPDALGAACLPDDFDALGWSSWSGSSSSLSLPAGPSSGSSLLNTTPMRHSSTPCGSPHHIQMSLCGFLIQY